MQQPDDGSIAHVRVVDAQPKAKIDEADTLAQEDAPAWTGRPTRHLEGWG